jgi:hypothetical protein
VRRINITNVFVLGMGIAVGILAFQLNGARNDVRKYREAARSAGIHAENQIALLADAAEIHGQLRDRAVQAELERDGLAKELDERPVVETVIEVQVPAATVEADPVEVDSASVHLTFEDEWLTAEVEFRPVDVTATLNYQIAPISIRIGARCGAVDPISGVRPAIITIDRIDPAPREGMEIVVSDSQISPDICNPVILLDESGGFDLKSAGLGALAVLGTLLIGR